MSIEVGGMNKQQEICLNRYRYPLLESEGFPPKIFGEKKLNFRQLASISVKWRKSSTDFNFGVTAVTDYFSNFTLHN